MSAETILQLTGRTTQHIREVSPGHYLHELVLEPYRQLVALAAESGFELRLASGFRSFDRQLEIWNSKASGQRAILDDAGCVVVLDGLSELEKVYSILRWSALPGASRHHWGTEVDIWDASAVDKGYRPQLIPQEYRRGGVFYSLSEWLDELISTKEIEFYRPYTKDNGGIAPELWHLSYRPVAENFTKSMNQSLLQGVLNQHNIIFGDTISINLEEIYRRFVLPAIE